MSRIDNDMKFSFRAQPVRFEACFKEVEMILKDAMAEKNIKFKRKVESDHKFIQTDPVRIQQMYFNIMTNAIHHSEINGLIITRVRIKPTDDFATD